jgi:putative tryptophan/tyrosine transport system substrate-binding protein
VWKIYRIGILGLGTTSEMAGPQPSWPSMKALLGGMRDLGYVYGEHYVTEPRGTGGDSDRFPGLAAELVRLKVDVISRRRPGRACVEAGNDDDPDCDGCIGRSRGRWIRPEPRTPWRQHHRVEPSVDRNDREAARDLKELVPGTAPVAVFWNGPSSQNLKAIEGIARVRGWKILPIEIRDANAIEAAFKMASDGHANAVLVFAAGVLFPRASRVAELAARSRLPAMYDLRQYVDAGGLISYGANINQIWRQAAGFVDRILKGAKPGDLPIEQPTKFELLINLKTAKALGLTIPPSLLVRADEVIE